MPSTYTVNLGIEKPATGEQSGTWGDTTNLNFDILDQAINGAISLTLASAGTSGSPNTLAISDGSVSDGRNKWIEFVDGGDLGATAYVQLTPNDAEKIVFIRNSLSGSRSVILFQGTYDAGRDLEVPAGVDMVVKFSGGGATATVTDVFTRLRATAIETPSLTATSADINGGTVDGATIGGATPAAGTFTNLTANTDLTINSTTTVDGILDEDNMASDSATKLATQQSIKAYVDSQVGTVDTLAEILANGNTTGSNNIIVDNGQAITTNTVNETTAGSGVTVDGVLLKDDGVNATNLEITNIKANDGTAAGSIANSTGAVTITSFISNSVDIGGGAIDDTVIGGSSANAITATTITGSSATISGDLTVDTNTLHVDSTNNRVGIGTTSPSEALDVVGNIRASGRIRAKVGSLSDVSFGSDGDHNNGIYFPASDTLGFVTSGAEAARFDSSGNLLFGQTSTTFPGSSNTTTGHAIRDYGEVFHSASDGTVLNLNRNTSDGNIAAFRREGSFVGSISITTSAVSYNTTSDYRLKEDIQPMVGASERVLALNPVNFAWKASGERVDGFLAHEAQAVVPEAVHGTKDEVDEDGNPVYQGIDQSKLVPLLTAALQEALGRIETLEAEVAALKA